MSFVFRKAKNRERERFELSLVFTEFTQGALEPTQRIRQS